MDLKNEFKVLGLPIENFSLFYGFFLVAWGVIVSFISGSSSLTSYIPTFIGFALIIFSYLAIKITSRKKALYTCSRYLCIVITTCRVS